jgi:hypothetical protein
MVWSVAMDSRALNVTREIGSGARVVEGVAVFHQDRFGQRSRWRHFSDSQGEIY